MTACAFNALAARLVGINVQKMVCLSFALSAAVGAVAGASSPPLPHGSMTGALLGLKGFAAAVLGGLGSGTGSIVAGFHDRILESFERADLLRIQDAIACWFMLVILWVKPSGLFGSQEESELKKF